MQYIDFIRIINENKTGLQPVSRPVEEDVGFFKGCLKGVSLVIRMCPK